MSSLQSESPGQSLDAHSLSEQRHQVENFTWIQCDNVTCQKWRKVPALDVDDLDVMKWFCNMNTDPMFNSCDATEEDYTAYDRLARKLGFKYVLSCLPEGALVWAKTPGYCRWPAVVTRDPECDIHYEVDSDGFPCRYHVEYLGKSHCHAWVPSKHTALYGYKGDVSPGNQENPRPAKNVSVKRKRKRKLAMQKKNQKLDRYKNSSVEEAVQEADQLVPLTSRQRLDVACKFRGSNSLTQRLDVACKFKGSKSLTTTSQQRLNAACKFKGSNSKSRKCKDSRSYDHGGDRFKRRRENTTEEDGVIFNGCPGDRTCEWMSERGDSNTGGEETTQNMSSNEESALKFEDLKLSSSLLHHSTEERFTISIQQYKRNEKAFDHDLHRFIWRNGLEVQRMAFWNSKPVHLFQLFLAVHERGGYLKVCENMQWSAVYNEVTDSIARGQCGHRAKLLYWRNIYPYELYIKGQNYQSVIKSIKDGKGIAPSRKKSKKSDQVKDKVKLGQTGDKFQELDNDTRWRADEDKCESPKVLPPENSFDFDHILQELHNNSNKISQLQDEMEGTQTSLGMHIKFHDDSTPPSLSDGLMEAHTAEEFCCAGLPVEEAHRVPSLHFTSSESNQSQDVLHELQAMEETFDDVDKEISLMINDSYL